MLEFQLRNSEELQRRTLQSKEDPHIHVLTLSKRCTPHCGLATFFCFCVIKLVVPAVLDNRTTCRHVVTSLSDANHHIVVLLAVN